MLKTAWHLLAPALSARVLAALLGAFGFATVRAVLGRSSRLRVLRSKSMLYGGFVWACRALLNSQKRRVSARADDAGPGGDDPDAAHAQGQFRAVQKHAAGIFAYVRSF